MANLTRYIQQALIALISIYRYCISAFFGPCCRFEPSCSSYAQEAIQLHGSFFGCCLALRRVLCCHPWHTGGLEPVPSHKITFRELFKNFWTFKFKSLIRR